MKLCLSIFLIVALTACTPSSDDQNQSAESSTVPESSGTESEDLAATGFATPQKCSEVNSRRRALFGDLHVHSAYSFDAVANSLETYSDDAHRFAKGEAIPFFPLDENGKPVGSLKIDRPLDFVSVTDHGEFLGERALCRTPGSPAYDEEFCQNYRSSERQGMLMLGTIVNAEDPKRVPEICGDDGSVCRKWAKGPWDEMIRAAENAQDRSADCEFTALIGYEYTGTPGISNIHRNVIFKDHRVPDVPISYVEAPRAEQLWARLDSICEDIACEYLTIPHNSNLANGRIFSLLQSNEEHHTHDEYVNHDRQRLRHEPVVEIFQHKGNSECFNNLSTIFGEPDELCGLEAVRTLGEEKQVVNLSLEDGKLMQDYYTTTTDECGDRIGAGGMVGGGCVAESDFHRSNLLRGIRDEKNNGVNSAKLGVIASTDTHASAPGHVTEKDWRGHVSVESTPDERLQAGLLTSGIHGNPGGLAGVYATENSRNAIFEALKRREVFGTSGPRIQPRFFASFDFPDNLCSNKDWLAIADDSGVPMGADLKGDTDRAPEFLVHAIADRYDGGTPLQQLQVIKGWVDAQNKTRYRVFEVAGNSDNNAAVDVNTGKRSGQGYDQLCALFKDPEFDPAQHAFYYMRAVENPSLRWSTHDCLRIPEDQRPDVCAAESKVPKTIQEMAWSSPIWYAPN